MFRCGTPNVFAICLPSHTSIWSQPNDAGAIASFKACIGGVLDRASNPVEACKGAPRATRGGGARLGGAGERTLSCGSASFSHARASACTPASPTLL